MYINDIHYYIICISIYQFVAYLDDIRKRYWSTISIVYSTIVKQLFATMGSVKVGAISFINYLYINYNWYALLYYLYINYLLV